MSRGSSVSIPKSFSNSSNLSVASSQKSNSSPLAIGGTNPINQDARAQQMARIVAKQRKRAEINADAELIRECAREAVDGSGVRVKGDRVLSRNRQLSGNFLALGPSDFH